MDIKETIVIKDEFTIEDDVYIGEFILNLDGEHSWIEYREHPKDGPSSPMSSEVTLTSIGLMEELGKRLIRHVNLYRTHKAEHND